jgi:hypothetical protein
VTEKQLYKKLVKLYRKKLQLNIRTLKRIPKKRDNGRSVKGVADQRILFNLCTSDFRQVADDRSAKRLTSEHPIRMILEWTNYFRRIFFSAFPATFLVTTPNVHSNQIGPEQPGDLD